MESKWREKLTRVGSHTYQKLSQCQGQCFYRKMAYMNDKKISEIRNALSIIVRQVLLLDKLRFDPLGCKFVVVIKKRRS
ncbi:hypothetical protein ES705_34438 [subsurface metagenome]